MAAYLQQAIMVAAVSRLVGKDTVNGDSVPIASALSTARLLTAPLPSLKEQGEFEGLDFWEQHEDLLTRAWQELGPRHADLYSFGSNFERRYVHPALEEAAKAARSGRGEEAARSLFQEVAPGVFATDRLFSKAFLEDLLEELQHIEGSGIPRRRPNGMNRYGVILGNVGMEPALQGLVNAYLRPLAAMLFPELVGAQDAEEHYAFTVRYEASGDTELAKHRDASVVTLNVCLGQPGWLGGELRFFESGGTGLYALPKGNNSAGSGNVAFRPGLTLIHRGQHKHQAMPLLAGVRTNAIIWLMGRHGVVRVAPYPEEEQLTAELRWSHLEPRQSLEL